MPRGHVVLILITLKTPLPTFSSLSCECLKPLRLKTFDLGDIWSRNRRCELEWTFEKKIPQILREEPLSAHNSHVHSAQSATVSFFPHPSHVSFSCPAPCVCQTKWRFSYGFRLGSISEPQDCRAELSGARLKSRLPIPHAAHISETDKILPLGTLRKKKY